MEAGKQILAIITATVIILLTSSYYLYNHSIQTTELPFPPAKYPAEEFEPPNEGDYYTRGKEIDGVAIEQQFFDAVGQDFTKIENEFVVIDIRGREKYANSPIKNKIDTYINQFAANLYIVAYSSYYAGARFDPPFSFDAEVEQYVTYNDYTSIVISLTDYSGGGRGNYWSYIQVIDENRKVVPLSKYIEGKITTEDLIEKVNEEIDKHPNEENITRVSKLNEHNWILTETGDIGFIYDPFELSRDEVGQITIDIDF